MLPDAKYATVLIFYLIVRLRGKGVFNKFVLRKLNETDFAVDFALQF